MAQNLIRTFEIDGDQMSIYNFIEELNETLEDYGLSLEVDGDEHDGFDIVELKEITDNSKFEGDTPTPPIRPTRFFLSEKEEKDIQEWKEHIKAVYGDYGRFEYRFVPTEIGSAIYVKSSLAGIERDFTDIDSW